jgi:hypothetical protein
MKPARDHVHPRKCTHGFCRIFRPVKYFKKSGILARHPRAYTGMCLTPPAGADWRQSTSHHVQHDGLPKDNGEIRLITKA